VKWTPRNGKAGSGTQIDQPTDERARLAPKDAVAPAEGDDFRALWCARHHREAIGVEPGAREDEPCADRITAARLAERPLAVPPQARHLPAGADVPACGAHVVRERAHVRLELGEPLRARLLELDAVARARSFSCSRRRRSSSELATITFPQRSYSIPRSSQ
jgi:hypothetical protein